jgi:hypothetical protein
MILKVDEIVLMGRVGIQTANRLQKIKVKMHCEIVHVN